MPPTPPPPMGAGTGFGLRRVMLPRARWRLILLSSHQRGIAPRGALSMWRPARLAGMPAWPRFDAPTWWWPSSPPARAESAAQGLDWSPTATRSGY